MVRASTHVFFAATLLLGCIEAPPDAQLTPNSNNQNNTNGDTNNSTTVSNNDDPLCDVSLLVSGSMSLGDLQVTKSGDTILFGARFWSVEGEGAALKFGTITNEGVEVFPFVVPTGSFSMALTSVEPLEFHVFRAGLGEEVELLKCTPNECTQIKTYAGQQPNFAAVEDDGSMILALKTTDEFRIIRIAPNAEYAESVTNVEPRDDVDWNFADLVNAESGPTILGLWSPLLLPKFSRDLVSGAASPQFEECGQGIPQGIRGSDNVLYTGSAVRVTNCISPTKLLDGKVKSIDYLGDQNLLAYVLDVAPSAGPLGVVLDETQIEITPGMNFVRAETLGNDLYVLAGSQVNGLYLYETSLDQDAITACQGLR